MSDRADMLLVVPSAEHAEAVLTARARASGFADASSVLTLSQLLEALEGAAFLGRRPCTALTSRWLVSDAALAVGQGPFGAFIHEPAFARAAGELFAEAKGGGLTPESFGEAIAALDGERLARARYLARVFERYERRLEKVGLADAADVLRGAVGRVRSEGVTTLLRGARGLEVRGLYDFSPLRTELILSLADACERAGLRFKMSFPAGGSALVDATIDPLMRRFEAEHERLIHSDVEKDLGDTPLSGLGDLLFRADATEGEGAALAGGLEVVSLASTREELRHLARQVRSALADGVAPEQIAVCFRDLGAEAEALVEELEALGIPARTRLGAPLHASAAGQLALGLPALVEDHYPAAAVSRMLTSRYAPSLSKLAPDAPRQWLAQAGIRDDRMGAQENKGAYAVRLEALARRAAPQGDGGPVRRMLQATQALLDVTRLPEEATAGAYLETWWKSLQALGLFKALRRSEPRDAEGTPLGRAILATLARDQAAGEALETLASELRATLVEAGASLRRLTLRAFDRWLQDAAADLNLVPQGPRVGAVRIMDLREVVGRRFTRVFVGGLVDGRLPGRAQPDLIFGDEERIQVNRVLAREVFRVRSGEDEGRAAWRLAEDRLLFFQALVASEGPVLLTWSRADDGGRERIASPFLDELQHLTGVKSELRPSRLLPPLEALASEAELRERLIHEALAPVAMRSHAPEVEPSAVLAAVAAEPWFTNAAELAGIEDERLRFFSQPELAPGPFTGRVEISEEISARLRFDPESPLSASALNAFGNCRFQGLLQYVLRLRSRQTPGEELDALARGSFWHKVLEELFPRLAERGLLGKPVEELPPELLAEAIDSAAAATEKVTHVGHPEVWRLGQARARSMVTRLLSTDERGLPFGSLEPRETEWQFGRRAEAPEWSKVSLPALEPEGEPIFLEGKIDRLDGGGGALGVLDYKAGAVTKSAREEDFLVADFQLPLYLYAARSSGHQGALHAAWLSLKDGEVLRLERVFDGELDTLLSVVPEVRRKASEEGAPNLANAVHALVTQLRAGDFAPRAHDCGRCDYRSVCRISERRVSVEAGE